MRMLIHQKIKKNIISNNLSNTGLFKILPDDSFLQTESEVFFQPLFSDWRLIDANFLVSGKVTLENNRLKVNFKLWDVYQEKLVINKNISGVSYIRLENIISYYF